MAKKEKEEKGFQPDVGDKILCESKGSRYEAKVLQVRPSPDQPGKTEYKIHYLGWSKNWDEWAVEDLVYPLGSQNDTLMKEQKFVTSKAKVSTSGRKKSLAPTEIPGDIPNSSASSIPSRSKDVPITLDTDDIVQPDKEVKINIPDELKNWLLDDDNCIKNKKLTILPARSTISMILKDFLSSKRLATKTPAEKEAILNELTLGIKDYFNVMLGSHLLYKFERLQYQNLLKDEGKDVDLTNHYGVTHLIRLMTKIGKPLATTTLDPQNVQVIVNYIQELLKFVAKQSNLFDLERNYAIAQPEYIKNALK